jgi:hypothetical protein
MPIPELFQNNCGIGIVDDQGTRGTTLYRHLVPPSTISDPVHMFNKRENLKQVDLTIFEITVQYNTFIPNM